MQHIWLQIAVTNERRMIFKSFSFIYLFNQKKRSKNITSSKKDMDWSLHDNTDSRVMKLR